MSETAWQGYARTNWVRVSDLEGLKEVAACAGLSIKQDEDNPEFFCLLADVDNLTGFPSTYYTSMESMESVDFTFDRCIMPYIEIGEVLVVMEIGGQKFDAITGYAHAFIRRESGVNNVELHLDDVYGLAARAFNVEENDITEAID